MEKKDRTLKTFIHYLIPTILAMALVAVIGNIFIEPFSYVLGADDTNIGYAVPYLRCIMCYITWFMYDVFAMTYMKKAGHPNVAMTSTVIGTLLNVILDCLFVFIHHVT